MILGPAKIGNVLSVSRNGDSKMTRLLSTTFRSVKPNCRRPIPKNHSKSSPSRSPSPSRLKKLRQSSQSPSPPPSSCSSASGSTISRTSWCVYLILSTNHPIKTYVGVTTNFARRLKQHNGELRGGAKASRAGRPWVCACLVKGFNDRSEACGFESKWKSFSRKLPRCRSNGNMEKLAEEASTLLLQHRQLALDRVKGVFDCSLLTIDWKLDPS